jgi:phage host-nuclease inhibitor protein Gam
MTEEVARAEVDAAYYEVSTISTRLKARARMITSKARDITESIDNVLGLAKEKAETGATTQTITELKNYSASLKALDSQIRETIRKLEDLCDKVEALIL